MSNMSYCRFQNTRSDLQDCVDALEEAALCHGMDKDERRAVQQWGFEDMSRDEAGAALRLIQLAREIVDAYGDDESVTDALEKAKEAGKQNPAP